ncbi:unnamed protein product [Diabrotica balteata]|uniref:Uncharacterized protein n=1 Tax=Diabrotica balteata TaxID=107213 RepID=A0A9N9TDA2_DIABA|nr:unnamed protein product [Diabrotica balteata]
MDARDGKQVLNKQYKHKNHDYFCTEQQLSLPKNRRDMSGAMFIYKILHGFIDCPNLLSQINFNVPHQALQYHNVFNIPFHRTTYDHGKKLTREERLQKKREAEKLRYQKIKNDPEKYELQKQKEKQKYLNKKEKGLIKTVDQMTPREQRKAQKIWRKKASERRQRLVLQNITNHSVTPSMSDVNDQSFNSHKRVVAAKHKSDRARRQRYLDNKKKDETINKLKTRLACYRKRLQRLRKPEKLTPNSKVEQMLNSPSSRDTVKKNLLFAEVLNQQLKENYSSLPSNKEKRIFKRMISGKLVRKYGILQNEKNMKPLRKIGYVQLLENKRKAKTNCEIIKRKIINFLQDDSNTRLCAGKRNYLTKKGDRKQKRVLVDTLRNLHISFMKNCNIKISYSRFCRLKPFWIIQPNCDKRDLKWESVSTNITDPKSHKERKVTKYLKKSLQICPRDLVMQLEYNLDNFFQHELNIVHQHSGLRIKKTNLTVKEAVFHMDFSENYLTKYAEEIQAFHFGGSRQQISLHTVVSYTKEEASGELKTTCYCSLSQNLLHSPLAIWAHLQLILNILPPAVEILHFWSDGPVTQYRNKYMFYFLVTHLTEFYPNLTHFTWNYHEAGHGKGAPDGVGAVCKRFADRLVASGQDIASLSNLSNAIQKNYPSINVFVIDDESILEKEALIASCKEQIKSFPGTLRVHQVSWSIEDPKNLKMKSLCCFCNGNCDHFKIGVIIYSDNKKAPLRVEDVYGPNSESENENPYDSEQLTTPKDGKHQKDNDQQPSTSKKTFKNGDFILVKLFSKKQSTVTWLCVRVWKKMTKYR